MVKAKQRGAQFLRARMRQKTNPVIGGIIAVRKEVTATHATYGGFPDNRRDVVYIVIAAQQEEDTARRIHLARYLVKVIITSEGQERGTLQEKN
jgi:hypothetical protein